MTPPTTRSATSSAYATDSFGRRWLARWLRPTEILAAMALVASLVAVLGWRIQSPASAIAALEGRVTRTEARIDTLYEELRFTNYIQCVAMRTDHPELLPPECAPIERAWKTRQTPGLWRAP